MRGAQVKPEDVKGVATAKLRLRVPQCLAWPAIACWNRDGRTRRLGVVHAYLQGVKSENALLCGI